MLVAALCHLSGSSNVSSPAFNAVQLITKEYPPQFRRKNFFFESFPDVDDQMWLYEWCGWSNVIVWLCGWPVEENSRDRSLPRLVSNPSGFPLTSIMISSRISSFTYIFFHQDNVHFQGFIGCWFFVGGLGFLNVFSLLTVLFQTARIWWETSQRFWSMKIS